MDRASRPPGRTGRAWAAALVSALALALPLAGAGQASAADVNNARNAGFESGLGNWTCSANSGTTVSSPVHGGTAALKATPAGQDNARCSRTVAVRPNSSYRLSGWVQGGYAYLGVTGTVVMWTADTMRPDGFRVVVSAFNSGAQHEAATREAPALTVEELTEIALSPKGEEMRQDLSGGSSRTGPGRPGRPVRRTATTAGPRPA